MTYEEKRLDAHRRQPGTTAPAGRPKPLLHDRAGAAAETAPDFSRPGFVYLIGHDSALKIGWTERYPSKGRLAALQSATERTLEIIGYVLGTVEDERRLDRRFSAHRIRGEWFHPVQEIVAYFQEKQP